MNKATRPTRADANSLRKGLGRDVREEGLPFDLSPEPLNKGGVQPGIIGIDIPPETVDSYFEDEQPGGNGGIDEVEDREMARQQIYAEPEMVIAEIAKGPGSPFGTSY